jgi:hypothetical protein
MILNKGSKNTSESSESNHWTTIAGTGIDPNKSKNTKKYELLLLQQQSFSAIVVSISYQGVS